MEDFIKKILNSIYLTFIFEKRYRFFLEGLGNTLVLTLASFLIGTLFAIILCAMARSENKTLNRLSKFITSLFVEIPSMVLLMIMVYIIFGRTILPVLLVVIFGLSLKTGAYLAEIFYTAISTVSPGEIEAARTLGMSKWQAFRLVMLPQAVETALPLYKNQFIFTMQETSIVGYLAIIDLTRASSIVSSRTMDAFFGLISVTIIYFVIGFTAKKFFDLFGKQKHIKEEEVKV
ncbi:MAG: amino acid ABC transporter permease [Erysipelotrichaceae bacterium]|nr:amino acid ABC transporter permease [Erysipelotrichaceae bacterium]